jgi:hypothetical protein
VNELLTTFDEIETCSQYNEFHSVSGEMCRGQRSEFNELQSRHRGLICHRGITHSVRGDSIENREDFGTSVALAQHGDENLLRHGLNQLG